MSFSSRILHRMRKYFETEMRLLKEAALEFAAQYPDQARMLNLQAQSDQDPYIERLLEGVAFSTSQIRQKIDDDIPEISASLLQQLWPHLLRPFPSMTIMQFAARTGQLQQTHTISKNTTVQNQPTANNIQACKFRTTSAVKLNPIQIDSVQIIPAEFETTIKLNFTIAAGAELEQLDLSDLQIFLHAQTPIALDIHHALTTHTKQIKVLLPQQDIILGQQEQLKAANLEPQDILLPAVNSSFFGFHLLQEYFLFHEKYLFVTICGLDKIAWPKQTQQFSLEIQLRHVFALSHLLTKDIFQLHCAPAINLFTTTSEPIKLTREQYEHKIITDAQSSILYSVDQVIGTDTATGKQHIYQPLTSFKHQDKTDYYYLRQHNNKHYLTLCNNDSNQENISCNITCCNGNAPSQLQTKQINVPEANFPQFIQFHNLTPPTSFYMPPQQTDYRWTLISHLSLNYRSLNNSNTLHQLLQLYDWSKTKINQQHIDAIETISTENINKIHQGALTHGIKFKLTIDATKFSSQADIHLLGLVLHHFFSMYTNINTLITTQISCYPSNKEFIWEPIVGKNQLI